VKARSADFASLIKHEVTDSDVLCFASRGRWSVNLEISRDEKTCLRKGYGVRSQVIDVLERQAPETALDQRVSAPCRW
jgi:3'-phosphoadenosine 5'-phosphosulfate sulfotransferase